MWYKTAKHSLDFDKGFILSEGYNTNNSLLNIRIPLFNEEDLEIYIENGFNSIFDCKIEKSLKINKKLNHLENMKFKFK